MSTATQFQLLPEVESFLSRGVFPSFVGGKDFHASSGETIPTLDPGSCEKLADIHELSPDEVDVAVDVAAAAFPAWA